MNDKFDVTAYVTVNERIQAFWKQYPNGRLVTKIWHLDGPEVQNRMVVVKAEVFLDSEPGTPPSAVDWAKEREGIGYVSKTSFIENAATSAIGRALATKGFLVDKNRASREEIEAVKRREEEHAVALEQIKRFAKKSPEARKRIEAVWASVKDDPTTAIRVAHELEAEMNAVAPTTK